MIRSSAWAEERHGFAGTLRTCGGLGGWKRIEYDRLVDLGVFEGEPLELIGGQLIVAEPKGTYHSSAVVPLAFTSSQIAVLDLLP